MKTDLYEGLDKIRSRKVSIIKRAKYAAVAGGFVFSSLLTGCSDDVVIDDRYTIDDVIDSYKEKTTLDENLSMIEMTMDNNKKIGWSEVNNRYLKARYNNDIKKCNKYLYMMQKMILECKLLESLNFNLDELEDVKLSVLKEKPNYPYVATLEFSLKEEVYIPGGLAKEENVANVESFVLKGLAEDVSLNMSRAREGKLDFSIGDEERNTNIDDCYRTVRDFALGESEIEITLFGKSLFVVSMPTAKKIKSYKLDKKD